MSGKLYQRTEKKPIAYVRGRLNFFYGYLGREKLHFIRSWTADAK